MGFGTGLISRSLLLWRRRQSSKLMPLEGVGILAEPGHFFGMCWVEAPAKIAGHIGADCAIGAFSYVGSRSSVLDARVGRFCSIAPDVGIGPGQHPTDWLSTHPFVCDPTDHVVGFSRVLPSYGGWLAGARQNPSRAPASIGNDVWIGQNAIVMSGVRIGDGAIIGAGAVVTKDVPPYAVVAGVPARVIRFRFDEATVQDLLELQWWNYDLSGISGGVDYSDVTAAVSTIRRAILSGTVPLLKPPAYLIDSSGSIRQVRSTEQTERASSPAIADECGPAPVATGMRLAGE